MNNALLVKQLFDIHSFTYSYLLINPKTADALIIDPVLEQYKRDLQLLKELGLKLIYCIETHIHADHITSASLLREELGTKVIVPVGANVTTQSEQIHDQEMIFLGDIPIKALSTPGHTNHHMSYIIEGKVFTGDSLFIRGCGRTDFQNGDAEQLYQSITDVLFKLPNDTIVFPGHDYQGFTQSTIGEEKSHNPRLKGKNVDEFVDLMNNLKLALPKKILQSVPANLRCGNYTCIIGKLYPHLVNATQLLEIGSSAAFDAIYLANYFPDAIVQIATTHANITMVKSHLEKEKLKNLNPPIEIEYTKPWSLRNDFDATLSFNLYYNLSLKEIESIFKNATTYLKNNGLLCVYEPFKINKEFPTDSIKVLDEIVKKINSDLHIWDFETINHIARENNFSLVSKEMLYGGYFLIIWKKSMI